MLQYWKISINIMLFFLASYCSTFISISTSIGYGSGFVRVCGLPPSPVNQLVPTFRWLYYAEFLACRIALCKLATRTASAHNWRIDPLRGRERFGCQINSSEVHSFHPSYAYPTEVCQHLIQIRNRTRDKSSWLVSVLYHVKTKWLPPTFASTRADTRHLFTFRSYLTEWISISGIHSSGRGVAPQQQQPTLP